MKKLFIKPEISIVNSGKFLQDEVITMGSDTDDFTNKKIIFDDEEEEEEKVVLPKYNVWDK